MSLATINTEIGEIVGSEGTISTNLAALIDEVGASYDKVETVGGTVPQNKNTNNLAPAIEGIGNE